MAARMLGWSGLGAAALLAAIAIGQDAGDPEAGRQKAALCAACHGANGISANPLWPNLAGQQRVYLANQIRAFRDGERVEVTMQPFVENLTDEDIEDLAAFYADLSPCP